MGLRSAPLLVVLLVLVACDGGDEVTSSTVTSSTSTSTSTTSTTEPPATTSTTSTSTTSTTTTTTTTTSTTTTSTTTTTAAPTTTATPTTTAAPTTCPAAPAVPAGADALTGIAVDLNLDGQPDTLQTYVVPAATEWHVRVEWGGGGATDTLIAGVGAVGSSEPIGEFDVDGDGTLEFFLTVGSGASAVLVGLYDIVGCNLERITIDGAPAVFPIGATVGNVSGMSCGPVGDLDRLFASRIAADEWEGGFEPFTLSGSVLTSGFGDGATFTDDEANALAAFDCGSLTL